MQQQMSAISYLEFQKMKISKPKDLSQSVKCTVVCTTVVICTEPGCVCACPGMHACVGISVRCYSYVIHFKHMQNEVYTQRDCKHKRCVCFQRFLIRDCLQSLYQIQNNQYCIIWLTTVQMNVEIILLPYSSLPFILLILNI